jgi:DNA-binding LytR/AlgR family response regulator
MTFVPSIQMNPKLFAMETLSILRLSGRTIIPKEEILYLESDWNYTNVHTLDKRKHTSGFTLKILEKRISDKGFLRINKGLLINRQFISQVSQVQKEAFVLLTNGQVLPVSRRKYKMLRESVEGVTIV